MAGKYIFMAEWAAIHVSVQDVPVMHTCLFGEFVPQCACIFISGMPAIHVAVKDVPAINACLCAGCAPFQCMLLSVLFPLYRHVSVQDVPAKHT